MRGIKEREVVACIISMLLCYNSKDTAASWRASMTIEKLTCAVKHNFRNFFIITIICLIDAALCVKSDISYYHRLRRKTSAPRTAHLSSF
jgi:hypothetical protein